MRVLTRPDRSSRHRWEHGIAALISAVVSTASQAAMLTVDGFGRVTGITDLVVGTEIYDVEFKLGTFASIFGSAAAFDFTDTTSAQVALQAVRSTLNAAGSPLLALTDPTTNLDPTGFAFSIPYDVVEINPPLRCVAAGFSAALALNRYASTSAWAGYDSVAPAPPLRMWADFVFVPEPAASPMLASGVVALLAARSRRRATPRSRLNP